MTAVTVGDGAGLRTVPARPAARLPAPARPVPLVPAPLPFAPDPAPREDAGTLGDGDAELRGTVMRKRWGELRFRLVTEGPGELIRPGRPAGGGGDGVLRLCRPLAGEVEVRQDGRHGVAGPPDLICFDGARPFGLVFPALCHMVEVLLPYRLVGLTAADARGLTATALAGTRGPGALLSVLLAGAEQHCQECDTSGDLVGGGVAGLVAALLVERMEARARDSSGARRALMPRIQGFIRDHLCDPALSPAMVAEHCNVSVRYLQKLFQDQDSSPSRRIRDLRLARCRTELADPRLDHLPVSLIGERSGFPGASHFGLLFRARYGLTPRQYRQQARAARIAAR